MAARLLLREKFTDTDGDLTEAVVWQVPVDRAHPEGVRYRLAFVSRAHKEPAVLYDNHHPKGHHRHLGGREEPYRYSGLWELTLDFEKEIAAWKRRRQGPK